jgi:tetratricopeptide (TPR) repeat protein
MIPRALYVPLTARHPVPADVAGEATRQRVAAAPLGWFASERENLLAAVEAACAGGRYRQGRELALRTAAYLHMHSYHEDAERMWTTVGDAAERAGDIVFGARAWLRAAVVIAADRGHHARAVPLVNRCLTVFEEAGDPQRLARAYGLRCYCTQARGRSPQARADGERGLDLARQINDVHAEFFCLRMLTPAFGQLGRHDDGITSAEQALHVARELDSVTYRCSALYALIKAHLLAGQPDEVIGLGAEGLTLSVQTGHELVRGHFHQQIGFAYQQLRRHDDAIDALRKAANDFVSRRDRYQAARCLRAVADSYHATGYHDEALRHLNESITAFRTLGVTHEENEAKEALTRYRASNR